MNPHFLQGLKYLYGTHRGPNGEITGDIVICIDDTGKDTFIKKYEKYIIMNPDGGNNDVSIMDLNGVKISIYLR